MGWEHCERCKHKGAKVQVQARRNIAAHKYRNHLKRVNKDEIGETDCYWFCGAAAKELNGQAADVTFHDPAPYGRGTFRRFITFKNFDVIMESGERIHGRKILG